MQGSAVRNSEDQASEKEQFSIRQVSIQKLETFVIGVLTSITTYMCFSVIAPIFPAKAKAKGMSPSLMGFVFSCYELWVSVFALIFGNYMTEIGPKFLLVSGQFLAGGCAVLFGLLDKCPPGTPFAVLSLCVRCVEAVGAAAVYTSVFSIMAAQFPSHVTTVFAIIKTMNSAGWLAGPAAGGLLYELGGYSLPFWALGGLLLFTAGLTAIFVVSPPDAENKTRGSIFRLLRSPLVAMMTLILALSGCVFGFYETTFALHLEKFQLKTMYVGLLFALQTVVLTIACPAMGWIADKRGETTAYIMVATGTTLMALSLLLMGPAPFLPFLGSDLWPVIVGLVLMGIGVSGPLVCSATCIYAGARRLGYDSGLELDCLVSGVFSAACHFGMFWGPMAGSALFEAVGFEWSATISAALLFISVLCLGVYALVERTCLNYASLTLNMDTLNTTDVCVNTEEKKST